MSRLPWCARGVLVLALCLSACNVSEVRTVEGLVVEIVSTTPADVQSFSLRTPDATVLRFEAASVDLGHGGLPTAHLREHQVLAEPIRVTYRTEGQRLIAVRLEDGS